MVDFGDRVRHIPGMSYLGKNQWEKKCLWWICFILFIRFDAFIYIVFVIFR
jgi:hypothetical protein